MTINDTKIYRCTKCGAEHENPINKFYKSTWSQLYNDNDKYCPVCKKCLNELFDEYSRRYKSDRTALLIICHYIDIPFYYSLYDSLVLNNSNFSIGMYTRLVLNQKQYQYKTFVNTLIDKRELGITEDSFEIEKESKWSKAEIKNKNEVLSVFSSDPFDGYNNNDRKFLFSELIKYLDEDVIDDPYKLSQIIQIVNNNNQIRNYDIIISSLNPIKDSQDIKMLGGLKKDLVGSNDKIAKENEISVKNRSNKDIGKSTLTYLMKDLRDKGFKEAEVNYYNQLKSEGTLWAISMSNRALLQNGMFDENDKQEIFDMQRDLIQSLQSELDDAQEKNRLLLIDNMQLKANGDKNE